uniref:natterin-3-like n=1 Tax=Centroberyx gerrardi TaxID=166262 RepID=UPI003AACD8CC
MTVKTHADIFAGRNKYGLGNIFEAEFFLPWKGRDYKYSLGDGFEILTVMGDQYEQKIFNVRYSVNEMTHVVEPPTTKAQNVVDNFNCKPVQLTAHLQKSIQKQSTWEVSGRFSLSVSTSMTVKVPFIGEANLEVELSAEATITNSNSVTETTEHSLTVNLEVPPNHACMVEMTGKKRKTNIPFTATVTRVYSDGTHRTSSLTGTYNGVDEVEVHISVRRCEPIPIAKPCHPV